MKRIIFATFICLFSYSVFAQKEMKIDSTFNHYFKVLDLELKNDKNIKENIHLYNEIILDNDEKVYVSKYANQAINFLQKISKIDAPKKHIGTSIVYYVDKKALIEWREWYILNREKISWCKKKKEPYISFWRRLFK